jgi:hypothetical protein
LIPFAVCSSQKRKTPGKTSFHQPFIHAFGSSPPPGHQAPAGSPLSVRGANCST